MNIPTSQDTTKEKNINISKIKKKPHEPRKKIEKIYMLYIYREYLFCLKLNANDFLQERINFVEQRLNFSHFEGNIIP